MKLTKTSLSLTRKFVLKNHNLYNSVLQRGDSFFDKTRKFSQFKMNKKNNIVWLDMELTGLDVENDKILEVASLVTNQELEIISPVFHVVVHQPDDILANMNEWCLVNHVKSGLVDEVKKSNVSIEEADRDLLQFLRPFTEEKVNVLAGNSIWMDKIFLGKYMYNTNAHLHYRIIDGSSIKELCKRWFPSVYQNSPKKQEKHRAMEDIMDSVRELQYYKDHFFSCKLYEQQ